MTERASHTLAFMRRVDEKLERLHSEVGERFQRVEGRLGRIEDEILVLNGIALRLGGARSSDGVRDRHERGEMGWRVTAQGPGPR